MIFLTNVFCPPNQRILGMSLGWNRYHGEHWWIYHYPIIVNYPVFQGDFPATLERPLAEGAGFEPAIRFPAYTLSRRAPSTTRPPLRCSRSRVRLVLLNLPAMLDGREGRALLSGEPPAHAGGSSNESYQIFRRLTQRISISKQTPSRELRAMGYRKLPARPRHHAQALAPR